MVLKILNVSRTKSFWGILDKKFTDQISCKLRNLLWDCVLTSTYTILDRAAESINTMERSRISKHLVNDYTQGPKVQGKCHLTIFDNLRSNIFLRAN